jgi:hypothetical protein
MVLAALIMTSCANGQCAVWLFRLQNLAQPRRAAKLTPSGVPIFLSRRQPTVIQAGSAGYHPHRHQSSDCPVKVLSMAVSVMWETDRRPASALAHPVARDLVPSPVHPGCKTSGALGSEKRDGHEWNRDEHKQDRES